MFDLVAHSVCSKEAVNRTEALVDALLGSSCQHANANGIADTVEVAEQINRLCSPIQNGRQMP